MPPDLPTFFGRALDDVAQRPYLMTRLRTALAAVLWLTAYPIAVNAQQVSRVEFATERGEAVTALYAAPPGPERRSAVIYSHGTVVRLSGYEGAKAEGTDVADFVKAIAAEGYVAIAPIRDFLVTSAIMQRGRPAGDPAAWTEVVERGVRIVNGATAYLAGLPNVDSDRIAAIGFSEGGNVTLWAAMDNRRLRAVVLLAPAALTGMKYNLRDASQEDRLATIVAPVFLAVGAQCSPSAPMAQI
jgi:dienelactone hydrolase